jgi:transcriptional regulator with XRE-family HTH domain
MPGTFGPTLRRVRLFRGVSLDDIARQTKVGVDLWEDMERNDCRRWPSGIYARAYIREYAEMVGVDPDETIDEFCREFPQGDRRAERLVRGHAEIVGHELTWHDDLNQAKGDRRASAPTLFDRWRAVQRRHMRATAAVLDLSVVGIVAALSTALMPLSGWSALAVAAVLYHAISLALLGCTPAVWVIDTHATAHPQLQSKGDVLGFRRLASEQKDDSSLRSRAVS